MDFLDPKKQFRQKLLLISGYVLIAVAIVIGTLILLYQADGFGIGKNGTVIQNGLIFFSSQPNPASIRINGKLENVRTNTRIVLPAGTYSVQISSPGYMPWQRTIALQGGMVEHFDYPLLIPNKLSPKKIATYSGQPAVATDSPNQHWLIVQDTALADSFYEYDLTNMTKAPTVLTVPTSLLTAGTGPETWQALTWADDNTHLLLERTIDGKIDYILLDRSNVSQSVNLSQVLSGDTFTQISLDNKKYNQYFLYDSATQTLSSASLTLPAATLVLSHVLAYQTYGTNIFLYATSTDAPAGKVEIDEQDNGQIYALRSLPANTNYLLDLTTYSGTPYVAVGAASDNKIYIYQDPITQLSNDPDHAPVPIQVLPVTDPNYLSFSPNAQFIMAENGQQFAVYDIENALSYVYNTAKPLDAPQTNAVWMDGDRLVYISGGKLVMFDYDQANIHVLMAANPELPAIFPADDSAVYTFVTAPSASGAPQTNLDGTSLLVGITVGTTQ